MQQVLNTSFDGLTTLWGDYKMVLPLDYERWDDLQSLLGESLSRFFPYDNCRVITVMVSRGSCIWGGGQCCWFFMTSKYDAVLSIVFFCWHDGHFCSYMLLSFAGREIGGLRKTFGRFTACPGWKEAWSGPNTGPISTWLSWATRNWTEFYISCCEYDGP